MAISTVHMRPANLNPNSSSSTTLQYIGGLVGYNIPATTTKRVNGVLVSSSFGGNISNSYATGEVEARAPSTSVGWSESILLARSATLTLPAINGGRIVSPTTRVRELQPAIHHLRAHRRDPLHGRQKRTAAANDSTGKRSSAACSVPAKNGPYRQANWKKSLTPPRHS